MAMWSVRQMRAVFSMRCATPSYAQFIIDILRTRHLLHKDDIGSVAVREGSGLDDDDDDGGGASGGSGTDIYDDELLPEEQIARDYLIQFAEWDDDTRTM